MKKMKANFIFGKKQIILASLVLILGAAVYLNWQFAQNDKDLSATQTTPIDKGEPTENTDILLTGSDELLSDETGLPADNETAAKDTSATLDKEKADKANTKADAKTDAKVDAKATATTTEKTTSDEKTKNLGDALFVNAKTISSEGYFSVASLAKTKARDEVTETLATILNDEKLTEADKKDVSAKAIALTDIIEAESRIENLIKAKGFEDCVVYLTEKNANVVVKSEGLDQTSATRIKNIVVSEGNLKGENITITEIN